MGCSLIFLCLLLRFRRTHSPIHLLPAVSEQEREISSGLQAGNELDDPVVSEVGGGICDIIGTVLAYSPLHELRG